MMNYMWNITIDDYLEVIDLAKANGKKPGDSMEEEFLFVMKAKNKEPMGKTNKDIDSLVKDGKESGLKILNLSKYLNNDKRNR